MAAKSNEKSPKHEPGVVLDEWPRPPHEEHDWDTLLDGQLWHLRQGEHYECTTNSFRGSAIRAAHNRNKQVRTQVDTRSDPQSVTLQVVGEWSGSYEDEQKEERGS